jgi:hypothetical protein
LGAAAKYDLLEMPAYTLAEVASYLHAPYQTLRYWVLGRRAVQPIVRAASIRPPMLSFMNLLECHVLDAMRHQHSLKLPAIRRAIETLENLFPSSHPLVDKTFKTDGIDLFTEQLEEVINLSRCGQLGIRGILDLYLERIEFNPDGIATKFFPFVSKPAVESQRSFRLVLQSLVAGQ